VFVTAESALRIERAEAAVTRAIGEAVGAFVRAIGAGVAAYGRPGSPTNKIIGSGLDAPIDEVELASVEQAVPELRVELCTLASPESSIALTKRGYRLIGFENVLVRPLAAVPPTALRVERVTPATLGVWRDTTIDAFAADDATGVLVDHFSREVIAARLADAAARGADLAVITTAPGSQSQANVMKHGFTLAYARAILVK